jgi:probable rRNA maturation factor
MDRKLSAEEVGDQIEVQVAEAFAGLVPEGHLRAVAKTALRCGAVGRPGTAVHGFASLTTRVAVVITDDAGIQELNHDFLGIDAPTDVLSFSAQEEAEGFVAAPEEESYLGDVIVSYPRAVAQADEAGHPVEQELALLIVHGVLHLLGYDHTEEEERALMWARQETILARSGDRP